MLKVLKMTGIVLSIILFLGFLSTIIFIKVSPQFGGSHGEDDRMRYRESGHYQQGKFLNDIPTSMEMSAKEGFKVAMEFFRGVPNSAPDFELPLEKRDPLVLAKNNGSPHLIWFGHSAFLLQIDGKNILIDPMLGDVPSPHPWLGKSRFSKELPIAIEQLPPIDAIIISHDHYDHLDYGSIQKLKDKTSMFFVPLGVGAHLEAWGIPEDKIRELNWWEEAVHEEIRLVFTPARHFSGRGLNDRWTTMWGSWVIRSPSKNIYFSGDSGYGPHFKTIGDKYGPFDFAMMECGQYNERWHAIHMMPEETAQAAVDVQARQMMPIHWGAFTLALHSWTDPVERVTKEAEKLNMPVSVPRIGEIIDLNDLESVEKAGKWWVK